MSDEKKFKSTLSQMDTVIHLLRTTNCYDILPLSSKQVIFDKDLLVKKALAALLQHSLQSAPLWDSQTQTFCGMLTVTDFILLILYYYQTPTESVSENINQLKISRLKEVCSALLILIL
jgi:5'-AMP-activated protein kinase regulatory gamma subunit